MLCLHRRPPPLPLAPRPESTLPALPLPIQGPMHTTQPIALYSGCQRLFFRSARRGFRAAASQSALRQTLDQSKQLAAMPRSFPLPPLELSEHVVYAWSPARIHPLGLSRYFPITSQLQCQLHQPPFPLGILLLRQFVGS